MRTLFLYPIATLLSCQQETKSKSEVFFQLLNNYQTDSLQRILAEDFHITRTYTNYKTDRNAFFGEYLRRSKAFNGKYTVTKTISAVEPRTYMVQDQSDYLEYLQVSPPTWKITIARNTEHKIREVTFDTTETFGRYNLEIRSKEADFEKWLELHYPNETLELLHENNILLFERLKMYYKQN